MVGPIDWMGEENKRHGVCGFTSVMYMLYANNPQLQFPLVNELQPQLQWLQNDTFQLNRTMFLRAEIGNFLTNMLNHGRYDILNQITFFTRSFENYETWNVADYLNNIWNGDYSIAMPPEALMEYMKTMCGMTPKCVWNFFYPAGMFVIPVNTIVGLANGFRQHNYYPYCGLAHYVYIGHDGRIYSRGEQFRSIEDLNSPNRTYYPIFYIYIH